MSDWLPWVGFALASIGAIWSARASIEASRTNRQWGADYRASQEQILKAKDAAIEEKNATIERITKEKDATIQAKDATIEGLKRESASEYGNTLRALKDLHATRVELLELKLAEVMGERDSLVEVKQGEEQALQVALSSARDALRQISTEYASYFAKSIVERGLAERVLQNIAGDDPELAEKLRRRAREFGLDLDLPQDS